MVVVSYLKTLRKLPNSLTMISITTFATMRAVSTTTSILLCTNNQRKPDH